LVLAPSLNETRRGAGLRRALRRAVR